MRPLHHPRFEIDKVETPANLEHAQENLDRLGQTSRRSFFAKSMGAAAAGAAAVGVGASVPALVSGATAAVLLPVAALLVVAVVWFRRRRASVSPS